MGKNTKIIHNEETKILEARKLLKKGIFYKKNYIEELFHKKFVKLRLKVHKILDNQYENNMDYETLVHSILIDCRAIFLENTKQTQNSTLQNIYKNRGLDDYAAGIDEYFDKIVKNGKSRKEIIKGFVDKRLAHCDFLEEDEEKILEENLLVILDRTTIENIFVDILFIAIQYEEIRKTFGKNPREQLDLVLKTLTGTK